EQRDYLQRKRILEFDDVMNQQRSVVYGYRNEVLESENPRDLIDEVIEEALPVRTQEFFIVEESEVPDYEGLINWMNATFPLGLTLESSGLEGTDKEEADTILIQKVRDAYNLKMQHEDPEGAKSLERHIMLNSVDRLWQEHLYNMDSLREAVFLRSYGQKDPLVEYKNEAYAIFVELMDNIKLESLGNLFRSTTSVEGFQAFLANLSRQANQGDGEDFLPPAGTTAESGPSQTSSSGGGDAGGVPGSDDDGPKIQLPVRREMPKVGRNEPCPCGSGKKFKQCCGR
ncbi:MAG: SEC-C metal-binding domain-containing protein, partial [Verrucomicrobiota bacterium]